MTAMHLVTDDGPLCHSAGRFSALTRHVEHVSCGHCAKQLALSAERDQAEATERELRERNRAAAHAVGMGPIFDFIEAQDDTATERLLANLVGALAVTLLELGFEEHSP